MRKGRVRLLLYIITLLIGFLGYQLYQIQIQQNERFSSAAFRQRSRMSVLYQERGQILDRNMISFTGKTTEMVAVLQPAIFTRDVLEREWVAACLHVHVDEFINFSSFNASPRVYTMDEKQVHALKESAIQGVSIVERRKRSESKMPAAHLIGYTDDSGNIGLAGIEKAYQDVLFSNNSIYAFATTDANNRYLEEYGYQMKHMKAPNPLSVKLTLDYHMQKLAEEVMENMVESGAVAIVDILSGDVLVLASRPGFNPEEVYTYLDEPMQPLFNRAVAGYTPGSIFKIIVAAAALENQFDPDHVFECPGFTMVGDQMFRCWIYEQGSHGIVNFKEGFAHSCNAYFIQLGIHLGGRRMLQTAYDFGLGTTTGLRAQNIPENAGILPELHELAGDGNIANLAMGQGRILVTPLQAAGMTAIIANGGIRNNLNIVDSIVNKEGEIIRDLKKRNWERVISRDTALRLMEMMEATVEIGTGQRADIGGYGGSAGKTGSAETGLFENGRRILHAWFTGYFPYVEPRYAMCVFVEDGKGGGTSAAPVFAEIAARIMQWEELR